MDGTISRRHKSASRAAHVVHFTAAFYTGGRWPGITRGEGGRGCFEVTEDHSVRTNMRSSPALLQAGTWLTACLVFQSETKGDSCDDI